jgi:triacylglycerol esterase/lipase EstA (alpha/beta hydrolase family)
MNYIKVEGHSNLVRDQNTNAIINTNISEYNKYLKIKEQRERSNDKINSIESELNIIKDDIEDIKKMLTLFLDKN